MAQGYSLHIGLNRVTPGHYGGWEGELKACEMDARDMQEIARSRGFQTKLLLADQATYDEVVQAIHDAATKLSMGDFFFLTYSGYGGRVPDLNGDELEDDQDDTWGLYDRQIVDDELDSLWASFLPGTRVFVLSDTCFSGTLVRTPLYEELAAHETFRGVFGEPDAPRFRSIPDEVVDRTYQQHRPLYDNIQRTCRSRAQLDLEATILLISACQDNQLASDGSRNGLFTKALKNVWASKTFSGNYAALHRAIRRHMPPWQTPNYLQIGQPNAAFERQVPLTI